MALRLVNTSPGTSPTPLKPERPIQVGMRSETSTIAPGTIRVSMGMSSLAHKGVLPENEQSYVDKGAYVSIETSERRRPSVGYVGRVITSGNLTLTKGSNSDNDSGIYEFKMPIKTGSPVLGYFKFRVKTSWTLFSPDWCNLSNMTGMYFGLEHGNFNNACYAFLRKNVPTGTLVIGGPLQSYLSARPGQAELTFDWGSLVNNSVVEVWILYNTAGYFPTYTPVVEVWTRRVGIDVQPVHHTPIPALSLGQFPGVSTSWSNYRAGPSDEATLFFGNVGRTGDVLTIEDWALFPDFRRAVHEGEPAPDHTLVIKADAPVSYKASESLITTDSSPSKWFNLNLAGTDPPSEALRTQPGRTNPLFTRFTKSSNNPSGVEREEPRIAQLVDGFMVEAFVAGALSRQLNDKAFGAGFGVEDGSKLYQLSMIEAPTRTLGISKSLVDPSDLLNSFYMPTSRIDWTSLKLLRMTMDRRRSVLTVDVDESRVLSIPTTGAFPASRVAYARVIMGHLITVPERGTFDVSFLNYLPRYKAWEGEDGLEPPASLVSTTDPNPFVLNSSGAGSTPVWAGEEMVIHKDAFNTPGSKRYYSKPEGLASYQSVSVEFGARIINYTGSTGAQFQQKVWTGAGVKIFFGDKVLTFGFFDCGIYGRFIGIIPGSGSVDDIINQTKLGKKFSVPFDWLDYNKYRIVYKPAEGIQLWTSTVVAEPVLTIPWDGTTGFDLPTDVTPPSVAFGHFDQNSSSQSAWRCFRWGQGNGYDLEIVQKYPNQVQGYHFGGKAFVSTEFSE